ncbi:MAG: RodZ domain-containing protein [Colwellia sp.]
MKDEINKDLLNAASQENEAFDEEHCNELSDDIEVVGPGQMLSEARVKLSLTQEDVAKKLNFCTTLIVAIEQDVYDQKLPATFNRGYLRNYAKLVGITPEDIIASYESLGAAQIQRTELQSFSNNTAKQAEHSRLMWISYLIIAILFASTVLWWVQGERESKKEVSSVTTIAATEESISLNNDKAVIPTENINTEQVDSEPLQAQIVPSNKVTIVNTDSDNQTAINTDENPLSNTIESSVTANQTTPESITLDHAVFTFSGDCWVNIFDANNERIAWGIKKQGYIMNLKGKAPFRVTIGKPELVSITFNDEIVDMSQYNSGNIAKFALPVISE